MAEAGFAYAPAVAFPTGDTMDVAEVLGVQDRAGSFGLPGSSSPVVWNRDYERELSAGERERYNQTLLAESAEDVAEADRSGDVPEGRRAEEFATGGCFGRARAAVPSVWDATRSLRQSWMRFARTTRAVTLRRSSSSVTHAGSTPRHAAMTG